jgi:hypothetical protein
MIRRSWLCLTILAGMLLAPGAARARPLSVEVWTDRGTDAVYQPGDRMQVKVRASDDAYLLVYEIDTEGRVSVLFPYQGRRGFVEGRTTYRLPDEEAGVDLVVQQQTGESFVVALASRTPFEDLPWYLRPYDPRGEDIGYVGKPEEEQGVTTEGRVVGDPFVAMERIRRRVLRNADDNESFATSYVSYYVHHAVRYPRYLCYDCHRPGYYAWWDGFDPYFSYCRAFDFRVNWNWYWGPAYWHGYVPYYVFVYRADCPPRWRHDRHDGGYSSWDGWNRWTTLWSGPLVRYKSPPPPDYIPPTKFDARQRWRENKPLPPGFMTAGIPRGRGAAREELPVGRNGRPGDEQSGEGRFIEGSRRPEVVREPLGRAPRDEDRGTRQGTGFERPRIEQPLPRVEPRGGERRPEREAPPAPRYERPRETPRPEPRHETPPPRYERPREAPRSGPPREQKQPQGDEARGGRRGGR